jgi:hypothetical protein
MAQMADDTVHYRASGTDVLRFRMLQQRGKRPDGYKFTDATAEYRHNITQSASC